MTRGYNFKIPTYHEDVEGDGRVVETIYGEVTFAKMVKRYENICIFEKNNGERVVVHREDIGELEERKRSRNIRHYLPFDLEDCKNKGRTVGWSNIERGARRW